MHRPTLIPPTLLPPRLVANKVYLVAPFIDFLRRLYFRFVDRPTLIKTWTGLSVEESIRMTEDRENGESTSMVWPTLGSRTAKDQIRLS